MEAPNRSRKLRKPRRKKKTIPGINRELSWDTWIGPEKRKGKCVTCLEKVIDTFNFEAGHVIAESRGGTNMVSNLRPICGKCNKSMGKKHMHEFIRENGLWIGKENPYLSVMLQHDMDVYEMFPESAITPQLRARIENLRHVVKGVERLRDIDPEIGVVVLNVNEEGKEQETIPTNNGDRLEWKTALVNAIHRRIIANNDVYFTMEQLREHELERIVAEVHCTGRTPQNTMARELQLLRNSGIVLFVRRGSYMFNGRLPVEKA